MPNESEAALLPARGCKFRHRLRVLQKWALNVFVKKGTVPIEIVLTKFDLQSGIKRPE